MSNPEKRDERSMSDILASIRKIMAQEPALAMPPSSPRPTLNGVTGATLDLPREPELKLPAEKKPSEGAAPPAPPAGAAEPVSLDELLAETPRAAPPPPAPATAKLALGPADTAPASRAPSPAAPEWLFPKPSNEGTVEDRPLPVPPRDRDMNAKSPAPVAAGSQAASPSVTGKAPEEPKAAKEPAPPSVIGPPAPQLGDLGSVVPGKLDGAGSQPALAAGPQAPGAVDERPVLGPPLPGPLLGEPARAPAASEPLQEVPGADALRRLIANVVPPSAHPSIAPVVKAPEPAAAKPADAPKPEAGTKAEAKAAPTAAPTEAKKKPEASPPARAPAPAVVPGPKPAAAAAPASKPAATAPAPAPKPAAPATAAAPKIETPAPAPATKPAAPVAAKTMDETVVELLRPLLREWLNSNMPRLIEPALKAEIEALRSVVAKDKKD